MIALLAACMLGSDPIVTTPLGTYRGLRSGSAEAFMGIKYADVPFRFKQAVQNRRVQQGIQDATKPGSICIQAGVAHSVGEEECLFLNIWRPARTSSEALLPVLLWVHGGGFTTGSGSDMLFDGTNMVSGRDVVLVTINYRLGPLGFTVTDSHGAGGLNGIMDIVVALKYVRDNIHFFGGDPAKVTVFGESAGGCATCLLSVLPAAKGLLRGSITESGPCVGPWGPQSKTK
jgi:carboxylesterase type B